MALHTRFRRHFYTAQPIKRFIRVSKKTYLPGFAGFSIFEIWQPFIIQLKKTSLAERAAAISFNVFMAIPPTLIFAFTLIPYLPISAQFINELFSLIKDVIPGRENNTIIIAFLQDFLLQPRNELLSFGLLLALFFSSNALMGLLRSFDKNYYGFTKRRSLEKRQTALKLTFVFFFLTFTCVLLLMAQGAVLKWIGIKSVWLRYLITNARSVAYYITVSIL
ncbi:MAG TPA: YhjD/YihY/BrkB family envelope integrity protein [Chitinophagaceae bacterium]|nr:YhjD/YihY/BrkB family envelope integrity protein [Chitinophagaceae bacterium]